MAQQSRLFREALARFEAGARLEYPDRRDGGDDSLAEFLKGKADPRDAKREAEILSEKASGKFGKSKLSRVVPQEWITAILENVGTFIDIGNYATKNAPESVGLAWYAVTLILGGIRNNYELYTLFGTGLSDISELMIIIPHYDRLFDERGTSGWTPSGVLELLFDDIIKAYVAVLKFSLAVKMHLEAKLTSRIGHGIRDILGIQTTEFQGKLDEISSQKSRVLERCDDVFKQQALEKLGNVGSVVNDIRETVAHIEKSQRQLEQIHTEQRAERAALMKDVRAGFANVNQNVNNVNDNIQALIALSKPKTPWELAVHEFEKIQARLKPASDTREAFLALADSKFPETCEWVFGEKVYKNWMQETRSFLCIGGYEGMSGSMGRFKSRHFPGVA